MTIDTEIKGTVTRELPVSLTDPEMVALAKNIGQLNSDRNRMEGEAKTSAAQWKDRIAGVEAQISDLAERAHTGKINRVVTCNMVFDYRLQEVRVVRQDNGDALETRPMNPTERQPTLPGTGGNVTPITEGGKRKKKPKGESHALDTAAPEEAPPGDESDMTSETPPAEHRNEPTPLVEENDTEPKAGTVIDDPQTILDDANPDDDADAKPKKSRGPRKID